MCHAETVSSTLFARQKFYRFINHIGTTARPQIAAVSRLPVELSTK